MHIAVTNQEIKDLCNQTDYSEKGMPNHRTVLSHILSKVSYRTVLEIGCGDIDTYHEIDRNLTPSNHLSTVYVGFNQESSLFSNLKSTHDHKRAQGVSCTASLFLERDLFSLEEKGCYFDLICVTNLEHYKKIKDGEDLQRMLEKAFKHSDKLVLRIITPEENSSTSGDKSFGPAEVFFQRTPLDHFFPLHVYETIAEKHKKKMEVHIGPPYAHQGIKTRTNYLLFS